MTSLTHRVGPGEDILVEIYFDPDGMKGGKIGCYRARLLKNHKCHDAGTTAEDAYRALICTAWSLGYIRDPERYRIANAGCFKVYGPPTEPYYHHPDDPNGSLPGHYATREDWAADNE